MIDPKLVRKHIGRLVEVTVHSHMRHSKTGKAYTVAQYDRHEQGLHRAIKRATMRAEAAAYQHQYGTGGSKAADEHVRFTKAIKKLRTHLEKTSQILAKKRPTVYATDPDHYTVGGLRIGKYRTGGFKVY